MIPDSAVQSGMPIKRQALRSAEGTQIMNLGSSSYYYKSKSHPDGQTCRDDDLREHRADPGRFSSYGYRTWASSFAGRGLRSTTNGFAMRSDDTRSTLVSCHVLATWTHHSPTPMSS
jgi:hypothetical protein